MMTLIFVLMTLTTCEDQTDIIDKSYYDFPDEVAELDVQDFPPRGKKTRYINIHCTASKEGVDLSAKWFLDFFKYDRGWSRPGYNVLILLDGSVEILVPFDYDGYTIPSEWSNGVYGANSVSINLAYVGGVDSRLRAKDTRTEAQKRAMDNLLQTLHCNMPDLIITGHRDHSKDKNGDGIVSESEWIKSCPSFDVEAEYGHMNGFINKTDLFDYYTDSLSVDTLGD